MQFFERSLWLHIVFLELATLVILIVNMSLWFHINKRKQYINVLFKPVFVGTCRFSEGLQGILVYTFLGSRPRLREVDMFGDDEIDYIKAENVLTRSGSCIATISNRILRVSLDLCMNFFEM